MEQKSCENCLHYMQHYIKENLRFRKINDGHCVKRKRLKTMPVNCECWEGQILKADEVSDLRLKAVFERILKRLNEISVFLRESD